MSADSRMMTVRQIAEYVYRRQLWTERLRTARLTEPGESDATLRELAQQLYRHLMARQTMKQAGYITKI